MVYKLFILIFFLGIKVGYTNIIYDKNDTIITEIEMNNYKNALEIIRNDPMIKNDLVEWKLNEWVDTNKCI